MKNHENYYLLGQALAAFDPDRRRLTPACINNLLNIPGRASVVLRHVWAEMLSIPECRQYIERIDWQGFRPSVPDSGSFWLGYYHARPSKTA